MEEKGSGGRWLDPGVGEEAEAEGSASRAGRCGLRRSGGGVG